MNANMRRKRLSFTPVKKPRAIDLGSLAWNELRRLSKSCGVNSRGLDRQELEAAMVEKSEAEGGLVYAKSNGDSE